MKQLGVILLTLSLLFGMFPQTTMAAQSTNFEQDLTQYLIEISKERGFEVTKEDLEASLSFYELSLDDFTTIDELRDSEGEVIKADLSNLVDNYTTYDLDEATLQQLLAENGDDLSDYIFLTELSFSVYFYTEDGTFERDPNFDQDLTAYIATISNERGFEVTEVDIETALSSYGTSLEEFETVNDLSDFLGDVIKADLSNLDVYYSLYELDEQSLLLLLEEKGADINDYIFVYDLGDIVSSNEVTPPIFDEAMLKEMLTLLDVSDEELQRLEEYFTSLEAYFADPAVLEQYNALGIRILSLEDIPMSAELTEEQTAEILSIYEEALSILKIDVSFTLITDGVETTLSILELGKLEDLKNSVLNISIYGADSQFLADFVISNELIASMGDLFGGVADEVIDAVDLPVISVPEKAISSEIKTVKGAKLPKTASDYIPNTLLGLFIAFVGFLLYRKVRNVNGEFIKK